MEPKTKWHSCRLIVNNETGRVKWCVGSERKWKIRLKYLVLLPIILLPITLICVFLNQYNIVNKSPTTNETRTTISSYYTEKEIIRAEERDILRDVETAFVPPETILRPTSSFTDSVRVKRQNSENSEDMTENQSITHINNGHDTSKHSTLKLPRRRKTNFQHVIKNLRNKNKTICETSSDEINFGYVKLILPKINRFCSKMKNINEDLKKPIEDMVKLANGSTNTQTIYQRSKRFNPKRFRKIKRQDELKLIINDTDIEMKNIYENISNNELEAEQSIEKKFYSIFQQISLQNDSSLEMIRNSQAILMSRYMDKSANPCQDFYQYACGNWDKYNPIPLDKSAYDTFELLRERLDLVLKNLLEDQEPSLEKYNEPDRILNETYYIARNEEMSNESQNDAILKAKLFYKSCMNISVLQERGYKPLLDLLKSLGGWPIIDPEWNEAHFDWLILMAKLRLFNNDILISEWVGPDIQNSQEHIVQLDQTTLGLPSRDYYLDPANSHYLDAYKVFMLSVVTLLGAPRNISEIDVNNMVAFETELAKIIAPPEQRRNVTDLYQRLTIKELEYIVPQVRWTTYFNIVLNIEVNEYQEIVCYAMEYIHRLIRLIKVTPQRTLANYLLWRFVRHRINNLDDSLIVPKEKFYFVLYGREKSPPRWQNCVTQVNSNMGMAVGSLFVQKYFDEFSKNDTLHMTTEIQKSFRELLSQTTWLDSNTRHLARLKVDEMKLRIGYPDFILDSAELSEKYADINIQPDKYFENTLSILQHLTRNEQARLNQSVDKKKWNTAPAVVNAYYSRNKNQIIFPAGILQPPFYHQYFPRALNFGGIGVVIGHEITHGFDDKGRLFDRDGNLQRWWNDIDVDEFHGRAKCLIVTYNLHHPNKTYYAADQYNKYTITEIGVQVDGTNTQGENIADNGGIKQSFRAYQKWRKQNPLANETLPGFNMSENKLFFLNFAQVWCGAMRPEATRNKIKTAVHSPGRYRVIGTLSNFPEFAEEFNCPLGTVMNPDRKCNVW